MSRTAVAVAVCVAALALMGVFEWIHHAGHHHGGAPESAKVVPAMASAAGLGSAAPIIAAPVSAAAPKHVVRLSKDGEDRRRIAQQIADAKARRAAATPARTGAAAGATGSDVGSAAPMDTADHVLVQLQAVLGEVKAQVAECVEHSGGKVSGFTADLALTGDADIGTLIDASALASRDARPLPAGFDDCVRDVMQQLELPPIAVGDAFKVNLEFAFDDPSGSDAGAR